MSLSNQQKGRNKSNYPEVYSFPIAQLPHPIIDVHDTVTRQTVRYAKGKHRSKLT